jgi:hypothetical protein
MAIYVEPFKVLAKDKSLATATSTFFDPKGADNIIIQIETAGVTANTGSFFVQWIAANFAETDSAASYITISESPTMTLANANNSWLVRINNIPNGNMRVRFVPAGGGPDGTVSIYLSSSIVGIR